MSHRAIYPPYIQKILRNKEDAGKKGVVMFFLAMLTLFGLTLFLIFQPWDHPRNKKRKK